jgi:hypothetical protein
MSLQERRKSRQKSLFVLAQLFAILSGTWIIGASMLLVQSDQSYTHALSSVNTAIMLQEGSGSGLVGSWGDLAQSQLDSSGMSRLSSFGLFIAAVLFASLSYYSWDKGRKLY